MHESSTILAVITGTSRGIGAALAQRAANDGADVAVVNRTPTGVYEELQADLSEVGAWSAFASWFDDLVEGRQPSQVVFVHNAAMIDPIGFAGAVDQATNQTNVLLNSAAPQVLGGAVIATARRTGTPTTIVQVSSGAGKSPIAAWSSYCAAKAGVDMWVRAVGLETADSGSVRVSSFSPGVVDTGMQKAIRQAAASDFPDSERFHQLHGQGMLQAPTDVANKLWDFATSPDWPSGSVIDIRDL